MERLRGALRTLWSLVKNPLGHGSPIPLRERFDAHVLATVGMEPEDDKVFIPTPTPIGIPRHWGAGYFKDRRDLTDEEKEILKRYSPPFRQVRRVA